MHTNPFGAEAAQYAHLRPTYPDSLFTFLSTTVASRDVAWDCATGNGQAATHLARYFERVIATDESAEMIAQAPRDPRIEYWVAEAENSGIETHSVDLVTVASAIYWFDLRRFYAEVRRVVKSGGVIAAWTYYTPVFGNDIDAIIKHLAHDVLANYWDSRLHYVVDEFHDLPFPSRADRRATLSDGHEVEHGGPPRLFRDLVFFAEVPRGHGYPSDGPDKGRLGAGMERPRTEAGFVLPALYAPRASIASVERRETENTERRGI
jgi:SAM-dependent methyltransferase